MTNEMKVFIKELNYCLITTDELIDYLDELLIDNPENERPLLIRKLIEKFEWRKIEFTKHPIQNYPQEAINSDMAVNHLQNWLPNAQNEIRNSKKASGSNKNKLSEKETLEKFISPGLDDRLKKLETVNNINSNTDQIKVAAFCDLLREKGFFKEKPKRLNNSVILNFAFHRYNLKIRVQVLSSKEKNEGRKIHKAQMANSFKL